MLTDSFCFTVTAIPSEATIHNMNNRYHTCGQQRTRRIILYLKLCVADCFFCLNFERLNRVFQQGVFRKQNLNKSITTNISIVSNPIDRKADMDTDKENNYMIKKVEQ